MFGIRFLGGSMSAGALRNTRKIIAQLRYGSQCMAPLIGVIKLCRTMFSADATGDMTVPRHCADERYSQHLPKKMLQVLKRLLLCFL